MSSRSAAHRRLPSKPARSLLAACAWTALAFGAGPAGAETALPAAAATSASAPASAPAAPRWTTEAQLQAPETPQAIDLFWQTVGQPGEFTGQRGLRIAFMRFEQPAGAPDLGAVVIVSGRTESFVKYKEMVYDLHRAGYAVYIHDHRGQGLSEREPETAKQPDKGYVFKFQHYVDDLRQFIGTQVLPAGHHHHYLLAHSMGGAITALFLESDAPEVQKIDAAVLNSPMLKIKSVFGLAADVGACQVAHLAVKAGKSTGYVVSGGPYKAKQFKGNPYTRSPVRFERFQAAFDAEPRARLGSPTHGWLDASCQAASKARAQAGKVHTPVRVTVAGGDSIVHNGGAETFCTKLPDSLPTGRCGGDKGAPLVIPKAEHELFIAPDDARTATLNQAIGFFEQVRAGH